ncbi:MAG: hypothetical protein QGG36_27335 [Pirellulaceae bacterium]|nr:hypothetical protein [Pirellulaceae bacterium]MDP7019541.1 hypothetical protein [Pirellulaceae bacterium]
MMQRQVLASFVAVWALVGLAFPAVAQQADEKSATEAKQEEKEVRAKPRGRLPAYFSKVVSEAQREEIYRVQAAYAERLDMLRKQIAELIVKRDDEVSDVLTAEQRKRVAELTEAARARRAAKQSEPKPDDAKDDADGDGAKKGG